jgi:intraflagellar transport protein 81
LIQHYFLLKIRSVNKEIEELTNKRNVSNDPMEDKLTLFRQQAAIIARKKESTAEMLNDVRNDLATMEEELHVRHESRIVKINLFSLVLNLTYVHSPI